MKEIVEKLVEKGYEADKELALNLYNELRSSLRHDETIFVALPSILIALFGLLGLRLDVGGLIALLVFSLMLALTSVRYVATRTLLRRVVEMISRDPMDEYDRETWLFLVAYLSLWIVPILVLLRNSGII